MNAVKRGVRTFPQGFVATLADGHTNSTDSRGFRVGDACGDASRCGAG